LRTLLLSHPTSLDHDMGPGHPEQPARLSAIETALGEEKFDGLERIVAPIAEREQLRRVHPESYLRALEEASPREGLAALDSDTAMCPKTLQAARFAAGAGVAAVDAVMSRSADTAFVAVRPPGHHAGISTPMGFCFLNNIAIAARHAMAAHAAERIAILDFDVHHGNGTQEIFWADKNVLYCSTHQAPYYPGTGGTLERGEFDNIVNAPLFAGSGGEVFLEALVDMILPRMNDFRPDLILISAGFDAHERDPLGGLRLKEKDYSEATKRLLDLADRRCGGRIVSMLEGGYDLEALAASAAAHVEALMGG
jgi:acetoin utilization deacetylase AcuC-like enzyme